MKLRQDASTEDSKGQTAPTPVLKRIRWKKQTVPSIAKLPFPAFCVAWLPSGEVIVGGGGGTKGSGVTSGAILCTTSDMVDSKGAMKALNIIGDFDSDNELVSGVAINWKEAELAFSITKLTTLFKYADQSLGYKGAFQTEFKEDGYQSAVRYSPDGKYLATGGEDTVVRLWDAVTQKFVRNLGTHSDALNALDFSHSGQLLASTAGEKCCKVWRVADSSVPSAAKRPQDGETDEDSLLIKRLSIADKKPPEFRACRFIKLVKKGKATDGESEYLLTTVNDSSRGPGYLVLWDTATWKMYKKVKVSNEALVAMEVSPDCSKVAVSTPTSTLLVYSLPGLKRLAREDKCHDLPSTGLAFSPAGDWLLSVSADKSLHFLEVRPAGSSQFLRLLFNLLVVLAIAYFVYRTAA